MKLPRVDQAIEVCSKYLSASGGEGTEFEIYVTRYLQVLIFSSYEQEIKKIIQERASSIGDSNIESFIISCLNSTLRSLLTNELITLLNRFSPTYGEQFRNKIQSTIENQRAETRFNNIVRERHITAHDRGSSMTFRELIQSYEESHVILDFFAEIISQK